MPHKDPKRRAEYGKKWQAANREKVREANRKWAKANPKKVAERVRKYRAAHPERVRERKRRWAAAHPEKERERSRKRRAANPEKAREALRRRRAANPAKRRESDRRDYMAHAEKRKAKNRAWFATHPDEKASYAHKRRALKRGNGGSYTAPEWQALCEKYGNQCIGPGPHDGPLEADHVIPVGQPGGTSYITNIQPLCRRCNRRKHNKTIDYRPQGD